MAIVLGSYVDSNTPDMSIRFNLYEDIADYRHSLYSYQNLIDRVTWRK